MESVTVQVYCPLSSFLAGVMDKRAPLGICVTPVIGTSAVSLDQRTEEREVCITAVQRRVTLSPSLTDNGSFSLGSMMITRGGSGSRKKLK